MEQIAADSMERVGLQYEDGLCGKIALYAGGGRDTVRLVQSLASLAEMKGRNWVGSADLEWVAEAGHYQPYPRQKVTAVPRVGVVNGLAVTSGMGGAVLTVEVKMLKSTAPYLQVTGIVEEEEIRSPHGVSKRKSNARSSITVRQNVRIKIRFFFIVLGTFMKCFLRMRKLSPVNWNLHLPAKTVVFLNGLRCAGFRITQQKHISIV